MRWCELRAGLLRAAGSSNFVLGNPRGWLGTAYHEVLERIAQVDLAIPTLEVAVERLWEEAVAKQHQRARRHPLDQRFGLPPSWPGYHLARASVLLRARDLLSQRETVHVGSPAGPGQLCGAIAEEEFSACGGKLIGRPDLIRDGEVVDYKSGAVLEPTADAETEVVKAAYVRQLRIYGYFVKERLGWWPRRGLLLPIVGVGVEVALEPGACEEEAVAAVGLLEAYNAKIAQHAPVEAFASPSPQACKWCPFKLVCSPFWQSVSAEWSGRLDGEVIEGTVSAVPRAIHGGAAVAVSVDVRGGTAVPGRVEIAPLQPGTHPTAAAVGAGDRVRLVGLRARPDGTLVPTQRTVLVRVCDLPPVGVSTERPDSNHVSTIDVASEKAEE